MTKTIFAAIAALCALLFTNSIGLNAQTGIPPVVDANSLKAGFPDFKGITVAIEIRDEKLSKKLASFFEKHGATKFSFGAGACRNAPPLVCVIQRQTNEAAERISGSNGFQSYNGVSIGVPVSILAIGVDKKGIPIATTDHGIFAGQKSGYNGSRTYSKSWAEMKSLKDSVDDLIGSPKYWRPDASAIVASAAQK